MTYPQHELGKEKGTACTGSYATRRTDCGATTTRTIPQNSLNGTCAAEESFMNNIVYIVGAIVIVLVILSVLGLR
ncbi:MAG: hypothetical protein ACQEUM_15290 [Pseudomonadota bacterium]